MVANPSDDCRNQIESDKYSEKDKKGRRHELPLYPIRDAGLLPFLPLIIT
jgi:hypothetical protein